MQVSPNSTPMRIIKLGANSHVGPELWMVTTHVGGGKSPMLPQGLPRTLISPWERLFYWPRIQVGTDLLSPSFVFPSTNDLSLSQSTQCSASSRNLSFLSAVLLSPLCHEVAMYNIISFSCWNSHHRATGGYKICKIKTWFRPLSTIM